MPVLEAIAIAPDPAQVALAKADVDKAQAALNQAQVVSSCASF